MSIHLEDQDLANTQQMEVEINGPDGATHLILCTGVAQLISVRLETYTFLVGPHLSRRQFVAAIVSGAISTIQAYNKSSSWYGGDDYLDARLITINANYDEESCHVKVRVEVLSSIAISEMSISYNVGILAELKNF